MARNDLQSNGAPPRDMASRSGGMSLVDLERLLSDIDNQPSDWRAKSDKAMAYYDGKQLSGDRLAQFEETGEPKTIINLVQRTINGALGNEAKARLDWRAQADLGGYADVADAISERLKEAQRETRANSVVSEAYKSQLCAGLGWAEVSRNPDPLGYPYRVNFAHRNEVWFDWRPNAHADLLNAGKWRCRQRWVDVDEAEETLPKFRDVFRYGCHDGPITDAMAREILSSETFNDLQERRRSFNRYQEEWLDNAQRRRVRFYDVYYKQPKTVVALVSGNRRVRFDPTNPVHVMLVQRNMAQLVKGPSYVIRRALFAGPFRLFDEETKWRRFPLIPFWCYQDDEDGSPYGLVHGMIDPQDEYNERRSRLRWLLKAKQVFVDDDALAQKFNTFKDLALEVMRPDGFFVMNSARKRDNGLRIEQNLQLSAEQVNVMQDAKQLIQEVPGIYNALLGNNSDNVKSGVALNSLVEQSITSLGETNDNYREARHGVGEALTELIVEDLSQPNLHLEVGTARRRRAVVFNTVDERGMPVNMVAEAPVRTALADVPSTPAYRQQQQRDLTNVLQGVGDDPIARAALLPALIESTDIDNREDIARWMRQQYGVPQPGESDPQELEAAQAQQSQLAQVGQTLQLRGAAADVAKKEAEAAKAQVEVGRAQVETARGVRELTQPEEPDEDALIRDSIAEAQAA